MPVPLIGPYVFPGSVDQMLLPGAARSSSAPQLLKLARGELFWAAPMAIASSYAAG
jgi:hypothetical protein